MRVVLDTNILVSALIAPAGKPAAIYSAWVEGKFTLLTCAAHLDELLATLEKPRVAELIKPYKAGRLVNLIKGNRGQTESSRFPAPQKPGNVCPRFLGFPFPVSRFPGDSFMVASGVVSGSCCH